MIGSLDCSHFVWGNCPVADHSQYQGKEGRPTLVVEALADHNLFAWHAVFGYSGTLNTGIAASYCSPFAMEPSRTWIFHFILVEKCFIIYGC